LIVTGPPRLGIEESRKKDFRFYSWKNFKSNATLTTN